MTRTNGDLDATNRRRKRTRTPLKCHLPRWDRQRTAQRRNRRRQVDLLVAGIGRGWLR